MALHKEPSIHSDGRNQSSLPIWQAGKAFVVLYLLSSCKVSRGQALRDPLEHHFVLKILHFLGQSRLRRDG